MPQFSYTAVNKSGAKVKGTLDAPNEAEVRVILRTQQLRPLRIVKAGSLDVDLAKLGGFGTSVPLTEVLLFTRQLSILISSGIPLVQGLEIITGQITNKNMKSIVLAMREKITGGSFLWEAMRPYSDVFPEIFVNMIKAGESAGALETILKRLTKYLEDSYKLKKMVQGAMIYPIAVIVVAIVVVFVMLIFVIPKFEELLKSAGQELPAPTKFVINSSHFLQNNIVYILIGTVVTIFVTRKYLKTEEGKSFFDRIVLKLPMFGPLMLKVAVARFARTMQTLLSSGINLLDAIDICRGAIGNKVVSNALVKMRTEVEQGKTLTMVMSTMTMFPPMVVQMITVGETTGGLDKMLDRIADFYEEEVQNFISNLTKLIEPFVLFFLGGLVGGLLIAMYLPIFQLAGGAGA